uniref:Protein MGARP N-terminal domain-containing protein n=1 Tax=Scleropages formosus TaxID=113540 RepID=A0A8C9TYR9_SCLFO
MCLTVVPLRYMSSSVPGSSGGNFVYFAIFGVSLSAGAVYVYRTLSSDKARFKERITEMGNRPKEEWKPKPWPPKGMFCLLLFVLLPFLSHQGILLKTCQQKLAFYKGN